MNSAEIRKIIEREWDNQGMCRSCGFHCCLYEHEPRISELTENDIEENNIGKFIELLCGCGEEGAISHRGVRVYLD